MSSRCWWRREPHPSVEHPRENQTDCSGRPTPSALRARSLATAADKTRVNSRAYARSVTAHQSRIKHGSRGKPPKRHDPGLRCHASTSTSIPDATAPQAPVCVAPSSSRSTGSTHALSPVSQGRCGEPRRPASVRAPSAVGTSRPEVPLSVRRATDRRAQRCSRSSSGAGRRRTQDSGQQMSKVSSGQMAAKLRHLGGRREDVPTSTDCGPDPLAAYWRGCPLLT